MQVLIVEDEPLAQDILQHYVARVPGLELAGICDNALEAFGALNRGRVDLLLLDINMPEINGIDFLKSLSQPPLTIFTTAYAEFAITGYELNVVDYLLKPISFDRFLKAIQKAQTALLAKGDPGDRSTSAQTDILFVRTEGRLVKIDLTNLWLLEGLKDYVRLWTNSSPIVVHSTMKGIEDALKGNSAFLRVNKSYIVNLKFVSEVDGNAIRIKDQVVTIGATYKDDVLGVLNRYKLI
jgi:DNA-binding LytR/AlgR family response regulator